MTWNDCLHRIENETAALHPKVSPADFRHTLLISPRFRYLFGNNPKVACTTIRKLLIDAEYGEVRSYSERSGTLHYNEFLPFLNVWQLEDFPKWLRHPKTFKFCFVRNPYTRLLSGYLDKVVRGEPQKMNVLEALGKPNQPTADISFSTFVRTVCAMPVGDQDQHWRVQYYQTYQEGISYDFIGRFENLQADLQTVADHIGITEFMNAETFGAAGHTSRHHATGAASLLQEYYTPELCEIVQQGFAEDFSCFGYSKILPG